MKNNTTFYVEIKTPKTETVERTFTAVIQANNTMDVVQEIKRFLTVGDTLTIATWRQVPGQGLQHFLELCVTVTDTPNFVGNVTVEHKKEHKTGTYVTGPVEL